VINKTARLFKEVFMSKKNIPNCLVCGNPVKLVKNKTCSAECRELLKKQNGAFEKAEEKKKQTMLQKYGVENPAHLKETQEKRPKRYSDIHSS
jgi:predicted nucleic acid-binding Zn ribbon protein